MTLPTEKLTEETHPSLDLQPVPFPEASMTVTRTEVTNIELNLVDEKDKIPEDLCGHVFIMGPVGSVDCCNSNSTIFPSGDGTSLFNGDGMIYRLDFGNLNNQIKLTTQIVKTPCYYADAASTPGTKYANLGFFNLGLARFSPILGFRNELNTAFIPFKFSQEKNWRLLVTWDAGRPYEIDPVTLKVVTPIGWNKEWREQKLPLNTIPFIFQFAATGAHPVFDPNTNQLFMVNWGKSYLTLMYPVLIHQLVAIVNRLKFLKGFFKVAFWLLRKIVQLFQSLIHLLGGKSEDFVYLLCWNGTGDLQKWQIIHSNGTPVQLEQSMHQIGLTRDYIVLMDTAFKIGPEQLIPNPVPESEHVEIDLRDVLNYPQSPDTNVYIVRRADLEKPGNSSVVGKKVVIQREIAHFITDYDNPDGKITLHAAHNSAWDPAEWLHDYDYSTESEHSPIGHDLVGMTVGTMDINSLCRCVIDAETGRLDEHIVVSDPKYTWATSIYANSSIVPLNRYKNIYWNCWGCWEDLTTQFMYDLYKSYKYRQVKPEDILKIAKQGKPANLCRLDTEKMEIVDGYQFPAGCFGNSPQFVPRSPRSIYTQDSTDGYIVCVVLSKDSENESNTNNSEIWIFDAANLKQGPLCKLSDRTNQVKFGLTIHTTWLPEIAKRTASYHIPIKEDYEYLVQQQPLELLEEIQNLFDQEVYPHFEI